MLVQKKDAIREQNLTFADIYKNEKVNAREENEKKVPNDFLNCFYLEKKNDIKMKISFFINCWKKSFVLFEILVYTLYSELCQSII